MAIAVDAIFEQGVLKPSSDLGLPERSTVHLTIEVPTTAPMSELGRQLLELRERVIASADPLLDWSEIHAEVAARRGGVLAE